MNSVRNLFACLASAVVALAGIGNSQAQSGTAVGSFPSIKEIEKAAQSELQKAKPGEAAPSQPKKTISPAAAAPPAASSLPARPAAPLALPSPVAMPQDASTPAARNARLTSLLQQYGLDEPIPLEVLHGRFYVAVSLSIPDRTLKTIIHQAAAAGATVIFNGVDGTLEKTLQRLNQLMEEPLPIAQRASGMPQDMKAWPEALSDLSVRIAPKLFERFQISEVPAFVLVMPAGASDACRNIECSGYNDFLHASGDVSLAHALDAMARARPAYRATAGYFANRLSLGPRVKKEQP
jgi:type-F conjugative transfer system pilin assembly protein TrbC